MESVTDSLGQFIQQHGPEVGGVAALVFFLLEVFFELGRTEKKTLVENIKSFVLLSGAAVSILGAAKSFYDNYEARTPATIAAQTIHNYYTECVRRVGAYPATSQTRWAIEQGRLSHLSASDQPQHATDALRVDCLALAVRQVETGREQLSQIGWLNKDVALGDKLLNDEAISDTLYTMFGINKADYLGIGRSMPSAPEEDLGSRYSEASVREYWAPNVCAVTTAIIQNGACPQRARRAWGWRFQDLNAIEHMTVRDVLMQGRPDEGGDTEEYKQLVERISAPTNPNTPRDTDALERPTALLVRFQVFQPDRYKGTVGRPLASEVFFSSLADVIDLPVRDAYGRSGADDPNATQNSDRVAFMWVYQPQDTREYRPATWRNLFGHLRRMSVSLCVEKIATAPNWTPTTVDATCGAQTSDQTQAR
ncbi:MAG: hypothetical protein ABUL55_01325 [Pseudomonadota bacterium]